MKFVTCVARALLGGMFIVGGYNAAKVPGGRTKVVEGTGLPYAEEFVRFNGAAQAVGGTALALGVFPRAAAVGLIASTIPTTVVGHPFWKDEDPKARQMNLMQFLKNAAAVGGLMLVAAQPKASLCRCRTKSTPAGK